MDDDSKKINNEAFSDNRTSEEINAEKYYWDSVAERERAAEYLEQMRREFAEAAASESENFAGIKAALMERANSSRSQLFDRIIKTILFIGIMVASTGYFIAREPGIVGVFVENTYAGWLALFGVLISVLALLVGYFFSVSTKEKTFVDIDDKLYTSRIEAVEAERDALLKKIRELSQAGNAATSDLLFSMPPEMSGGETHKLEPGAYPSGLESNGFDHYLRSVIRSLDMNIELADNKASLLLDKGTTYLWRGIMFYIASIVIWQVATSYFTMGEYAVWGMISCSMTFLVVEFLAAWFLRQYKSFTDSSFNLVRVKSVFNRYFLSYLAIKEFSDASQHLVDMRGQMLKVLEEDIKWLEAGPQKAGDLNHMVAMFESVSGLVEKLKLSGKPESVPASGK